MTRHALPLPCLAVMLLGTAGPGLAQPPQPKPGDVMIEKFLKAETERLSGRFLDGATTLQEWQEKRPRLYREYMDMLGLWPLPEKTPLKATVTGTVASGAVVIEKLHYQSKPGLYVTANLYRPKDIKGKLPAVLYVCGHSNRGRDGNKTAFQDHGMWFASNGYVCLMVDTLQLGEIPGVHHGTYGRPWLHLRAYGIKDAEKEKPETRWWWQALGYTPAGVECWNGVRGLDYLVSRPDVDPEKLAVTGISGGGAATFWVAAADERVKCAVPVSGMSDLESYVTNKVVNGHCDCMFLVNTYQWEWTTIAALVAPRPLLFANSDNDRIFPMDGNRRIIERLRKLYKMYGKPGLVDEYVSKGGHDYRPDLRVAVFRWINKHVKNDVITPVQDSAEFAPLPGKELRVFPTDADIPKDALNARIDETFVPRANVRLPAQGKFEEAKRDLLKNLRARSFRAWPDYIPPAADANNVGLPVLLKTEPFIRVQAVPVSMKGKKRELPTLLVSTDSDKEYRKQKEDKELPRAVNEAISGTWGFTLYLRGSGEAKHVWTEKSPPNYVERAHALLGRTVDEGRVWDIIASVKYAEAKLKEQDGLKRKKPGEWAVLGIGSDGILAAYAALFEPSIKEVIIINPPKSHKDGPIFLNVLRVLDIPDALGLLAPNVKLTLVGARDPAFDRTEQLYRLAGAADKFTRK